ncbi:MAG: bifunctional ADP-dependent NAD(P)H-hydrate dehydratase/NAD(P)H-hydrate epimerase, partial [Propionibacteriaceae bacterium]|nr:bifunctional ADP-dependent NAD(P)H-hydrate dehydratase/NAD(P)H-hydrate epimerase [Propionibacteriaceae bacterium]
MRPIHTSDQVRAAERAAGEELTSGRLMAKAAAGLAKEVRAELRLMGKKTSRSRLLLLVGPGDNGGDGLHAGAELARRGATVMAWAAGERVHAAGAEALRQAGGRVVEFEAAQQELDRADLVIDAVFGL